jgi:hypothetical protein
MTTKGETVLQTIMTLLTAIGGLTVVRSRTEAINRAESPMVVVKPVQMTPDYNVIDFAEWTQQYSVEIYTRGDIPDGLADPFVQSIYAALLADRSLGGKVMDIQAVSVTWDVIDGDQSIGITDMRFATLYRTKASDLTQ